ncbi:single-stranded DNA-binding protein [bacterium]|nr:single-stranded DNA-binding protein [bacterium]
MLKTYTDGNIARDMEVKQVGEHQVGNFTIGCQIGYGERKETVWIECSIWGKRAQSLEPYLKKGVKVVVSGNAKPSAYINKEGEAVPVLRIDIDKDGLSFAGPPKSQSQPNVQDHKDQVKNYASMAGKEFTDDEIPF